MKTIRLFFIFTLLMCQSYMSIAYDAWKQIESDQFRVIFQENVESEAIRTLQRLEAYTMLSLQDLPLENKKLRKIDIIIYSLAHESNGNVGNAPSVSRWYNRPGNFANGEWLDILAVHEGRHIVQFNQVYDNALGNLAYTLFGENGSSLFVGALVPYWFLEGDAVQAETKYTHGGRGRTASFDLWWRTDLIENGLYNYDRSMLGTDFDRVPYLSRYVLGYFLTGHINENYDELAFDKILKNTGRFSGFTFDAQTQILTGKDLNQLYQETFDTLKQKWQTHIDTLNITPIEPLVEQSKDHWQSLYPFYSQSNSIYALQIDIQQGERIVEIKNNQKTIVMDAPKSIASGYLSNAKSKNITYNGSEFCWIETIAHSLKNYELSGDIFCGQSSKSFKRITQNDKLTSVIQLEDGYLAHRFTATRKSVLVKFDKQGNEKNQFELLEGSLVVDMSQTQNEIVFVLTNSDKNGIYKVDKNLTTLTEIMTNSASNIRSPILIDDWVVFTSDQSSIDQVLAYSLINNQVYELITSKFGAYYLNYNQQTNQLVFSDYQSFGQQLSSVELKFPDITTNEIPPIEFGFAKHTEFVFDPIKEVKNEPFEAFEVNNYNRFTNLINVHSWSVSFGQDGLIGNIQSSDIFEKLNIDLSMGYDFFNEMTVGQLQTNYRFDSGLNFNNNIVSKYEVKQFETALALPFKFNQYNKGISITPSVGLLFDENENDKLNVSLDYTIRSSSAIHAIRPKFAMHESLYTDIDIDGAIRVYNLSDFVMRGLSYKHAFDNKIEVQWLDDNQTTLINQDLVLSEITNDGFSLQTHSAYRVNLGAIGQSFTRAMYLRNMEVGLHLRNQLQGDEYQYAAGYSVGFSLNLFRNEHLIINPEFSMYYSSDTQDSKFRVGATLANQ
ncbi:hypothetical protein [Marinicellulosiphila megalodicopiae]|uniref:hypothetical protein n=1 Tax=Marinicellulosiphila megalodicopiae TaxID=2724896 RepID=UPI003BB1C31C